MTNTNTTISVTTQNDGTLAPVWATFPTTVVAHVLSGDSLAYAGEWGAPGAAFASALIMLDPFAYGVYFGDAGEDGTSDLVPLAEVDSLL
jgi:hypothetical protein